MSTQPKSAGKLTYSDYVQTPDDHNRYEVIDGELFVNPIPVTYHQMISGRILFQLYSQVEVTGLGVVFNGPVALQLSDHDIVQPDLVVILEAQLAILKPDMIQGVPDLVIEILSPPTIGKDRVLKRALYERCGIPEYWIVDPDTHTIEQLVLADSGYIERVHQDQVSAATIGGVTVNLREV